MPPFIQQKKQVHFMFRYLIIYILIGFAINAQCQTLVEMQLRNERVYTSMRNSDASLRKMFTDAGLNYPPKYIYWRAFKTEKQLELWASEDAYKPHVLIKKYDVCRLSGTLGFKHHEGDEQIPEGLYYINHYNPYSNYFLSFRVSYPNGVDSFWGDKRNLGGQIYIHGECETIGCLPMTDTIMQEIYWVTIQAQSWQGFGAKIPIHVFPFKPENEKNALFSGMWNDDVPKIKDRWNNLFIAYNHFERKHFPGIGYHDGKGMYLLDTVPPKKPRKLEPIFWSPLITYAQKSDTPYEMMRTSRFLKPIQEIDKAYILEVQKESEKAKTNYRIVSKYVEILPDSGEFRPYNAPKRYRKVIDTVYVKLNN